MSAYCTGGLTASIITDYMRKINKFVLCLLTFKALVVTVCTDRLNIKKFYVLPTLCIYVFWLDLKTKQRLFPYTAITDWFV